MQRKYWKQALLVVFTTGLVGLAANTRASEIDFDEMEAVSAAAPIQCDFAKPSQPSAKMLEVTKVAPKAFRCSNEVAGYELGFLSVDLPTATNDISDSQKISITVKCTGESAPGIYVYGGLPAGFRTSSYRHEHWFYNPRQPGRCFLTGSEANLKSISSIINQGVLVILPTQN